MRFSQRKECGFRRKREPFPTGEESLLPAVRASRAIAQPAVPGTGVSCRPRCTCSRARASVLAEVAADEPDLTLRRQVPTVEGQFLGGKLYQQFRAAEDGRLPPSCRCTGQHVRGNLRDRSFLYIGKTGVLGRKMSVFGVKTGGKGSHGASSDKANPPPLRTVPVGPAADIFRPAASGNPEGRHLSPIASH